MEKKEEEKYDFTKELEVGTYVDVRDTANTWCLAEVLEIDGGYAKVRFDGWGKRYDDTLRLRSLRIAPLRTFTRCYTGQRSFALRFFDFNPKQVAEAVSNMKTLIEGDLQGLPAREYNQFVRARLFILTDFLMTNVGKKEAGEENMELVLNFTDTVIQLVCKWLLMVPQLMAAYGEAISKETLGHTSTLHAVAVSFPELIGMLQLVFGLRPRCADTFKELDFMLRKLKKGESMRVASAEAFGRHRGFELIMGLVGEKSEEVGLPLPVLLEVLEPVVEALVQLKDPQGILPGLLGELKNRANGLSERNIRDIQSWDIDNLYLLLEKLSGKKADRDEILGIVFNISLQLLRSTLIQKKILGINLVNQMLPKTMKEVNEIIDKGLINYGYTLASKLLALVADHKLVEMLLGENARPEVIRKTEELFLFLLDNNRLAPYLELLWKCCSEKHEEVMKEALKLVGKLAEVMSFPVLHSLFRLIENTKPTTEAMIHFWEKYTLSVLKTIERTEGEISVKPKGKSAMQSHKYRMYNLDLFWNLMLDSCEVPGKLKDLSMGCMVNIFNTYTSLAEGYVFKAAHCIRTSEIVVRSMQFLKDIEFADYYYTKDRKRRPFYDLKEMNLKYRIVENTLKDCQGYHRGVREEVKTRGMSAGEIMEYDFGSRMKFREQSALYLAFLEYYCSKGKLYLEIDELRGLYEEYVELALCEQHSDIFFEFISKTDVEGSWVMFAGPTATSLYNDLCRKIDCARLTAQGFEFFKSLFDWNLELDLADAELLNRGKSIVDALPGVGVLFNIAYNCCEGKTGVSARGLLVEAVDQLCKSFPAQRSAITQQALEIALTKPTPKECIKVVLINELINKIECLKVEKVPLFYHTEPLITFEVEHEGKTHAIKLNEELRLSDLRIVLSAKLQVDKSRIVFITGTDVDDYDDDFTLAAFDEIAGHKLKLTIKPMELETKGQPRYILANTRLFETLQEMLCSAKDQSFADQSWELILTLPHNVEHRRSLELLEVPLADETKDDSSVVSEWCRYLGLSPTLDSFKITYLLHILCDLLLMKEKEVISEEKRAYLDKFKIKGGVRFILHAFNNSKGRTPFSKLSVKRLDYCLRILLQFLRLTDNTAGSARPVSGEEEAVLWTDILHLFNLASMSELEAFSELFFSAVRLHFHMAKMNKRWIPQFKSREYLGALMNCLIRCKNEKVQDTTNKYIQALFQALLKSEPDTLDTQFDILNMLMKEFFEVAIGTTKPKYYFQLMESLLGRVSAIDHEFIIKTGVMERYWNELVSRPMMERNSGELDHVLGGIITMLRLLLSRFPALKEHSRNMDRNMEGLLDALFRIDGHFPKCKHETTRARGLSLLQAMLKLYSELQPQVFKYLLGLHTGGSWRTNRKVGWSIKAGEGERGGNFVGFVNLGATCYLNSSLQQLFMIPEFRKGIIEANCSLPAGREESVLYQLQLIFSSLVRSAKAVHNPKPFTQRFMMEGRPLNVLEQKDVDEFIMTLLDRLDNELSSSSEQRLIKNLFKITIANEIICKDCPHRSETGEQMMSLILSVKKSLYESLRAFVQADVLEGENAYSCERCDRKVTANKRQNIKTLPNVLIVVLKRFEYDMETLERVKVNTYCEFPHVLDMKEFTLEGQCKRDIKKLLEKGTYEELSEEQKRMLKFKMPKDYYKYQLKGVIVHSGNADRGHYYSYIVDRLSNCWHEFNDTLVSPFDPSDIPLETFGGNYDDEKKSERVNNAYVLIYERFARINREELEQFQDGIIEKVESVKTEPISMDKLNVPGDIDRLIKEENARFWMTQYLFAPGYVSTLADIIENCEEPNVREAYALSRAGMGVDSASAGQFAVLFFLTTVVRGEDKTSLLRHLSLLKSCCLKNIELCEYVARLFSQSELLIEFFSDCPNDNARRWVAGLLSTAITQLYPHEKDAIRRLCESKEVVKSPTLLASHFGLSESLYTTKENWVILNFAPGTAPPAVPLSLLVIDNFVSHMSDIAEHNSGQYFKILCTFAQMGPEARSYLNLYSVLGAAFEYLSSNTGPCTDLATKCSAHFQTVTPLPLKPMTKEAVYMSKKYTEGRKPRQHIFVYELIHWLIKIAPIPSLHKEVDPHLGDAAMHNSFNMQEEEYLNSMKDAATLDTLLTDVEDYKRSLTLFSRILAYLTHDHEEFLHNVFKLVMLRLREAECNKLRIYFRLLLIILGNGDNEENKAQVMAKYFAGLSKANVDCFRIKECLIDATIKLAYRNPRFHAAVTQVPECKQMLEEMEKWMVDFPYPDKGFKGSIFRIKKLLKMTKSLSEKYEKLYRPLTAMRLERIRALRGGKQAEGDEWDSDDDLMTQGLIVVPNEPYDIYLFVGDQWVPCVAISATDEVAEFEYSLRGEARREWLELESDRIAPANSMVCNLRWQLAREIDSNITYHPSS